MIEINKIASETLELAKALGVTVVQNPAVFVEVFKYVASQYIVKPTKVVTEKAEPKKPKIV